MNEMISVKDYFGQTRCFRRSPFPPGDKAEEDRDSDVPGEKRARNTKRRPAGGGAP